MTARLRRPSMPPTGPLPQEHRFTEREQTHLFQAIQVYANSAHDHSSSDEHPALSLADDALKMVGAMPHL